MIFKCFRCGNTNHREEQCFFKDKRCFKCQKLGHISRVCKNGNWRSDRNNCSIDEEAGATNGLFNVNQVEDTSNLRNYMVRVQTSGRDINMLIDSGTGKNIFSEKTYIETWVKSERPRIEKDSTKLVQWNRQKLSILGKIKADVKVNKRNITMELLVVEGPGPNLIGREAFDQIGIGLEWINYGDSVCQITEEFMDVFKEKLGQYRGPPIHIKIKTLGKPTFLRARTLPYAIRPKVEEALRKMEEQGILTPVEFTRFATPIVPVLKRDGSIRICGDYRSTVNTIVESDTFPVPAAADLQVNLAGGKVFSKLDLKDAYQQLVVDEETAELLAINTHKGLFKVNHLPFGVSCAPGIFQRRMESLIAKIPGVVVYLDDILVTGKDEMEHDLRLREVLKSIQRMGLTLKKEKCEFKKSLLIFLGCRIDAEGIHPTEEKCEAIKNFPKPENKKELQSFLGLLNFYSKFLKDRTTVLEPLHRLLNKRNCWKWKEVEDRAFREAKNLIQSDLVLTPYDARKPLVLACDASPFGVGAVLSHVEEGMERPIAFASRTMSQTERSLLDKNSEPNLHTFKPDTYGGKKICLSRVNLSLSKYFRNFHLICVVLMLLILAGIEQNPGPKMSKQTTLETSLDRDKDIKDLINALTKRLDSWGERLESRLSAIDDRVENINQRLQQLEESSAVTKAALSQNSKKIKDLEDQLEHLDAKSRERNLIFYGIEQDNNEDCQERIRKVIEENMQTTEKINITRCHRLSRKPGAPILIEVPEQNDRLTLFKAALNLRGTKISLSKDYSMKMREQRRALNVKRRELVEKGTLAKLRDNKLLINGIAYKVCDGQIVDANGHSL
ncbi:K02A2.6-like [Cordylochernes scorpioides]|uniref:K02A2.6-like n=1 Tax=Cordylochernes scorpioides TaxID=51811 RepID=A0ABY6KD79_9ARAC|nr:K02A2.6-like [Cordylochernes scorpioides]